MNNSIARYGSDEFKAQRETLNKMVENAKLALQEAQKYADQTGLSFTFNPDPANYVSMDGEYHGKGKSTQPSPSEPHEWEEDSYGWYTSRDSC